MVKQSRRVCTTQVFLVVTTVIYLIAALGNLFLQPDPVLREHTLDWLQLAYVVVLGSPLLYRWCCKAYRRL